MAGVTTDLAERYGAPAPWRRRALVASSVVVVVLFAAWLAWTVWEQSRPLVASGELTFEVVDDGTAVARFRVELRADDVEATCTLKAYAADHTLVGTVAFGVEPGATRVEQAVATERRATSVELVGCTAPGQNRPR